jgi:PAS domain S-box-containing protein
MEQLQGETGESITRQIVENLGEAILVFESGTKATLFANRAAAAMTGHADPAFEGMTCHQIFCRSRQPCDPGDEDCLLERAASTGATVRQTHPFISCDGTPGTADIVATPMAGKGAPEERVIFSVRDITETSRSTIAAMEHLRDVEESSQLKALLTDIVGHDILNPASVIRYTVDILRESETDSRKQLLWEMLDRNLSSIIKIVENVSLYSKLEKAEELEYRPMDLSSLIDSVIANMEKDRLEKSLAIYFCRQGECRARVNPMMEDVFMNILSNAARHSPVGGRIAVDIADDGNQWIVSVRDSGDGVPDEAKEKIFNRFTRLNERDKSGALGLGLSIARRIMDLHGGSVQVRDAPGNGADFRIGIVKEGPGLHP